MPSDLVIFAISLFAFIISMIATLGSFFGKRTKSFWMTLVCVIVSGSCMIVELQRFLEPEPEPEMPVFLRQPPTPL